MKHHFWDKKNEFQVVAIGFLLEHPRPFGMIGSSQWRQWQILW